MQPGVMAPKNLSSKTLKIKRNIIEAARTPEKNTGENQEKPEERPEGKHDSIQSTPARQKMRSAEPRRENYGGEGRGGGVPVASGGVKARG